MIKFYVIFSLAWFVLLLAAIFNGTLREKFYKKYLGDLRAHQLSSIIFILLVFGVTYGLLRIRNLSYTTTDLFFVGGIWLTMTILFEFIFGHYIMKHSWKSLFQDYNIFKGRLWILILFAEFFAPILMSRAV